MHVTTSGVRAIKASHVGAKIAAVGPRPDEAGLEMSILTSRGRHNTAMVVLPGECRPPIPRAGRGVVDLAADSDGDAPPARVPSDGEESDAGPPGSTVRLGLLPADAPAAAPGAGQMDLRATPDAVVTGPGGCCGSYRHSMQSLRAACVQALATALTFGTKPFVEMAVKQALGSSNPEVATFVSGVVGSVYVGLIHTAASRLASGLMNHALGAATYRTRAGADVVTGEIRTVDLPVMGAFVAAYGARGAIVGAHPDPLTDALSKAIASTCAGFIQGAVTDALRQAYTSVYEQNAPVNVADGERYRHFRQIVKTSLEAPFASEPAVGHDLVGKIVGGVTGAVLSYMVSEAGRDLSPAARGAAGMTAYLTGWFLQVHTFAQIMAKDEADKSPVAPVAGPPVRDLEAGVDVGAPSNPVDLSRDAPGNPGDLV